MSTDPIKAGIIGVHPEKGEQPSPTSPRCNSFLKFG